MRSSYLLAAAAAGVLFTNTSTKAQMVGADIFLHGQYVEVGIGHLGYFGSDAAAPSGYHAHCPSCGVAGLGFVADVGMDGWTVGTPPLMGDYFVPGMPAEGWELEVSGKRCQSVNLGPSTAFVYDGGMSGATGANLSYAASGTTVTGIWEGIIDSIDVKQITTLDTNTMYFMVKVVLTNLASTPKNDIYYMRTLDPDNDQTWPTYGGGFPTSNLIEHQALDTTVVSATGASGPGAYLALGTTDTGATAFIQTGGLYIDRTVGLDSLYNGWYAAANYTPGTASTADVGIGLVMFIPHLASVDSAGDSVYRTTAGAHLHPANSATITYFYAFSSDAVDSAIAHMNAGSVPSLAIRNVNTGNNIRVYPNPAGDVVNVTNLAATDRVELYDMMGRTMTHDWNAIKEGTNTFRGSNIPSGNYVLVVTDVNGTAKARIPVKKM